MSNIKTTAADLVGRRAMSRRDLEQQAPGKGSHQRLRPAMPESGWKPSARMDDARLCRRTGAALRAIWDTVPGGRREKLREKGVPRELWDEALDELPPDGEQIDRFLQSKLHGRSPEDKEKKRLTDALLRRGFSWGEVRSAWGRYGSEIWEE